jgi:hypothetical protein
VSDRNDAGALKAAELLSDSRCCGSGAGLALLWPRLADFAIPLLGSVWWLMRLAWASNNNYSAASPALVEPHPGVDVLAVHGRIDGRAGLARHDRMNRRTRWTIVNTNTPRPLPRLRRQVA